jgi:sulfur carrier protein
MIEIYVNGEATAVPEMQTLTQLLSATLIALPYAVMLNKKHVVRRDYATTRLHTGDCVELITPMQGG